MGPEAFTEVTITTPPPTTILDRLVRKGISPKWLRLVTWHAPATTIVAIALSISLKIESEYLYLTILFILNVKNP